MQSQLMNRLIGSILLIAGCCIGAGMLGLPILSAQAGFLPSMVLFIVSWIFMATTGLLLLEVVLWFEEDVNIITMAKQTLGWGGELVAWCGFLFLFYTLMVAYIAGTGSLISDSLTAGMGWHIPVWITCLVVAVLLGGLIYLGTSVVDQSNRLFMIGLIVTYCVMIAVGMAHIKPELLTRMRWSAVTWAIPTMIISFGYHNLVPSITTYLQRNATLTRLAIIIGSALPLIVYALWQFVILGIIPVEDESLRALLDRGDIATQALRRAVSTSWIVTWTEAFAFFAIVTSFLGVALSFVDFLKDGLKLPKVQQGRLWATLLVVIPPLLCALIYPKAFLAALNYAGSFGAVTLFGLLPVAMVWNGRYRQKRTGEVFIKGGRLTLLLVLCAAAVIMVLQLIDQMDGIN